MPCLWVDKLIYVLSCSLHCRVTLGALSPHPFGSIFEGSTLIGSLAWTLDYLIALLEYAFRGSIIDVDNVLYCANRSSILGILGMIYYILYGI